MKLMLSLALAVAASISVAAPSEEEVLQAYGQVAARYPALVLRLFEANDDTKACQKAKVLDLTREGYQSRDLGPKLQKYNPWVYRNFTNSFEDLRIVMSYCYSRAGRARALAAAERMAGLSMLE